MLLTKKKCQVSCLSGENAEELGVEGKENYRNL